MLLVALFLITSLATSPIHSHGANKRNSDDYKIREYESASLMVAKNSWLLRRLKKEVTSDNYQLSRDAYERELNDSIADYYAQRKAVMDRYYARQREISEKFGRKSAERVQRNSTYDYTTASPPPTETTSSRDGYHEIGRRRNTPEESLVYQHNLGIGLKVPSDLDAAFEVILDESIRITSVELIPLNNSSASISEISGGPGYNYVKLKLTPAPKRGLGFTVKVWGVKD